MSWTEVCTLLTAHHQHYIVECKRSGVRTLNPSAHMLCVFITHLLWLKTLMMMVNELYLVYRRKNGSCAVLYGIMMKMLRRLLFSYWTASFFPFFIKKIHLGWGCLLTGYCYCAVLCRLEKDRTRSVFFFNFCPYFKFNLILFLNNVLACCWSKSVHFSSW